MKPLLFFHRWIWITVSTFLLSPAHGQVTDPSFDPAWAMGIQNAIEEAVANGEVRGTSVALLTPDQGLFIGVAGESEPGVPITPDMQFGIGSNSKLFTAVLIMKLQELGLLSIDDPISDYLPVFPHIDPDITIRQLLNHQSGIFDFETEIDPHEEFFENMNMFVYGPETFYTPEQVLDMIGPPHFVRGESYFYSNTNYLLAAMIVESVSGASFVENMHTYILDPLGLTKTFVAAYEEPNGTVAHGWHLGDDLGSVPTLAPHSMYLGSGSVFSTANDMVHWMEGLYNGEVITPASLAELSKMEVSSFYGMGLAIHSFPTFQDDEVWVHGGWVPGYTSDTGHDVKRRSQLCVLANDENDYSALIPVLIQYYNHYPRQMQDAAVLAIHSPATEFCESAIQPLVEIINYGSAALTSVTLEYKVDNGPVSQIVWTGQLLQDETELVSLSSITVPPGDYQFTCWTSMPNGVAEGYTAFNDSMKTRFVVSDNASSGIFFEGFEGNEFPPPGWIAGSGRIYDWNKTRLSLLSGNGAVVKNCWYDGSGRSYALEMPLLDLTTLEKPELRFNYAYGYRGHGQDDKLTVELSDDCGEHYTQVFQKSGSSLETAETQDLFFPEDDQWAQAKINLSSFKDDEVLIRFVVIDGWGNNLYLDNIQIAEKLNVQQAIHPSPFEPTASIYPNPAVDELTIQFYLDESQPITMIISDLQGQIIEQQDHKTFAAGENEWVWNCQHVPPGMYIFHLQGTGIDEKELIAIMR